MWGMFGDDYRVAALVRLGLIVTEIFNQGLI